MSKIDLVKIINDFAKEGFAFSNEQDFQFLLGDRIKTLKGVKNVFFEKLSLDSSITFSSIESGVKSDINYKLPRTIKQSHDILVELENKTFEVIELKYKTPGKICLYETLKGKNITFRQSAYDLGCYDFLSDVSRLENINSRNFLSDIKISKSFWILLTNDKNYRYNDFSKSGIWRMYSLCEKNKVIGKGTLTFKVGETTYFIQSKALNVVTLKNSYNLDWHDYELINIDTGKVYNDYKDIDKTYHPGFSYLISRLNKGDNTRQNEYEK